MLATVRVRCIDFEDTEAPAWGQRGGGEGSAGRRLCVGVAAARRGRGARAARGAVPPREEVVPDLPGLCDRNPRTQRQVTPARAETTQAGVLIWGARVGQERGPLRAVRGSERSGKGSDLRSPGEDCVLELHQKRPML